ncbi:angiogenic factor with G patch and FHA domains 1 [Ambystoma mexicanum]|uniref:angiogenic factor with G patch and FHA domains 1 n=1 Tax=Ambystoma mexicanum TaxID=8296 RepID=UPI0037E964C4
MNNQEFDLYVTECSPSPSPPSSPEPQPPGLEERPPTTVAQPPPFKERTSSSFLQQQQPPPFKEPLGGSLVEQLAACKAQVQQLERLLSQSQLKERIADTYNQDLRQQVKDLSREIHEWKRRAQTKTDAGVQTEEYGAWPNSGYYYYSHDNSYPQNDVPGETLSTHHASQVSFPVPMDQSGTDNNVHANTSTAENEQNGQICDAGFVQDSEKPDASSLAETLRATAEAALSQTGFTYDENTGMYFDHGSGFYYDAENQLYYDAHTGIYYYYDAENGCYKFHSRIDLRAFQISTSQLNKDKKIKSKRREPGATTSNNDKDIKTEEQTKPYSLPNHSTFNTLLSSTEKKDAETVKKGAKVVTHIIDQTIKCENGNTDQDTQSSQAFGSVEESDSEESNSEAEEGEISNSEMEEHCSEEEQSSENGKDSEDSGNEETEHVWPPCLRVIVIRSPVLETATLFVITAVRRATFGRGNEMQHTVTIPEAGVNEFHAEVFFDRDAEGYVLVDQGSQNGTIVNGNPILKPEVKSEPYVLEHGDEVKMGETVLSFHVHTGSETCYGCEPAQIRAHLGLDKKVEEPVVHRILSKQEKERRRKKELKNIRAKYGLKNYYYEENKTVKNPNYRDRAEKRRQTVGSEGTFQRDDAPASVNVEINETNKGHRMLKMMGWTKGQGLGKHGRGIKDPIQLQIRKKKAGLGAGIATGIEDLPIARKNKANWDKARERFVENFQDVKLKAAPKATPWIKGESD